MPLYQKFKLLAKGSFFAAGDFAELLQNWAAHGNCCAFSHSLDLLSVVGYGWMYHLRNTDASRKMKNVASHHGWIYSDRMKTPKKTTETRHGKLAETTAQTSVTMKKEIMEKARAAAKADNRSLSNWLEQVARKALEGGLILLFFAEKP